MTNAIYNNEDWKKWEAALVIRDIGVNRTYTPFYFFRKYAAHTPQENHQRAINKTQIKL